MLFSSHDEGALILGNQKGLSSHLLDPSSLLLVSAAAVVDNHEASPIHVEEFLDIVGRDHISTAIDANGRVVEWGLDRGARLEPPKLGQLGVNRSCGVHVVETLNGVRRVDQTEFGAA